MCVHRNGNGVEDVLQIKLRLAKRCPFLLCMESFGTPCIDADILFRL